MGKTRDLFQKMRATKGTFHAKMGTIKDRNGMDLTEADDIKNRWQEYTEELYKQDLHDPDNHDGVITHLEPDILECKVKWGLQFSSVQFSHSVMSNSLRPHESQHARPPSPSPTPGVHSDTWAFGSVIMNKASGGDGIPVELFQIRKDDAVKVLHSKHQQIWKTQQWPQDWKGSVFIPIPKKGNAKECSNYCTIALI